MVMRKLAIFFICVLFLLSAMPCEGENGHALSVKSIEIKGTRIIEEDTIRYQIKTRIGEPVNPVRIRQDISDIYKIGYIEDIQVESEPYEDGLKLIYRIKEKPWVKGFIFEGNKNVKTETLKEKTDFKGKAFFDQENINQNIMKLIQHYHSEGYYLAQINTRIEPAEEGWVNVSIVIDEGEKVKIKKLTFSGNEHFSDKLLKKQLTTKAYGFFSFLTKKGFLNREVLDEDRLKLQNFYLDRGFIHSEVTPPEIDLDAEKSRLILKFTIHEGDLYRIKDVALTGNYIIPTDNVQQVISIKEGDIYSRGEIGRDIARITDLYGEKGYLTTDVYPMVSESPEGKEINVTYNIKEGEPSYLRWINIIGNTKTRDKVIRREIEVNEGDLLDTKRMRESYRNIRNLGFFEEVNLQPVSTRFENQFDLDLSLEERLTGQVSFGAGYSSEDHLVGTFEIRQGNLFGRGQKLIAAAELGGTRKTYNLSFSEPYVMDRNLMMGTGIYYDIKEYDDYTRSSRGGDFNFGFPLPKDFRFYTNYNYEKVNIHDIDPLILQKYADPNQKLTLYEQNLIDAEGKTNSSSLLFSVSRDTRDDRFRPTSGSTNRLAFKYAGGFLGGDNWFYTVNLESGYYMPLPWWKFILALHGDLEYASGHSRRTLPVFERLYCGGTSTVRGYAQRGIGPADDDGNPTGGNKKAIFNLEVHLPIAEAMNLLAFFDAGNVFSEEEDFFSHSLRMSAGIGIRLFTPMGPMRLDWGYKLMRRADESPSDWHFAIGTYF